MSLPDEEKSSGRFPLRWVLRILATAVVLALLFWWLPFDELWTATRSVPLATWPLAVAVYLIIHLVGVVKWRLLVNAAGAGLATRKAVQSYYWGLFGNLFLPSLVGGDVVRAGMALRHVRSRSALLLGSLIDRLLDVIGLMLLAVVGAALASKALDNSSRQILLAVLIVIGIGMMGAAVSLRYFPVRRLPFRVRRRLVRVREAIRATSSKPGILVSALALGTVLQSVLIVLNWELGRRIGIDISLHVWFFVWPLAKLSGLLPLTQGGIGVREAAQAALFAPFGVAAVHAVATGLVFEVVIITGGLIAGAIALLTRSGIVRDPAEGASPDTVAGPAR